MKWTKEDMKHRASALGRSAWAALQTVARQAWPALKAFGRKAWPVVLRWLPLFALCGATYHEIFYMHRQVMSYESVSWYLVGCNHLMIVWDACFVTLLFSLFPVKRARWICLPLFLGIIYCVGNALFARNITGYMPLRAWLEFQNLHGMGGSIFHNLQTPDYIIIAAMLVVMIGSFFYKVRLPRWKERVPVLSALLVILTAWHLTLTYSKADTTEEWVDSEFSTEDYVWNRESYIFTHGIFWSSVQEVLSSNLSLDLTPQEREEIAAYLQRPDFKHHCEKPRNVIFVIVESLITDPLDQTVDGTEVTPTLNRLKREGFFAGNMQSEVRYGESSDGQFIYFTGLLPKTCGVTIFDNLSNEFRGLGTAARETGYQTLLLNATGRTFWRKDQTCPKYGLDFHYAPDSYSEDVDPSVGSNTWLNDEQIFDYAYFLLKRHEAAPTFLSILTLSTHTPYSSAFDEARVDFPSVENDKYRHYLQKANYMDYHLGRFMDRVENDSTLQDALVVIVSDHSAPEKFDFDELRPLPMIIYGRNIEPAVIERPVRQIDVYPTLLNLMGYDRRPYMGLGHSVLDMDSTFVLDKQTWNDAQRISNMIIYGDYWGTTPPPVPEAESAESPTNICAFLSNGVPLRRLN